MPDPIFADPRLAPLYDLAGPRDDLEHYLGITRSLGAHSVLDVGCGTGSLALLLADTGLSVTGADPALASLDVARGKPGTDRVRWVHGDATTLPSMQADLAIMTGNVAQVFLSDEDWAATLRAVPDGTRIVSDSTLRRRSQTEFEDSLTHTGFTVLDIKHAPDRPPRVRLPGAEDERGGHPQLGCARTAADECVAAA